MDQTFTVHCYSMQIWPKWKTMSLNALLWPPGPTLKAGCQTASITSSHTSAADEFEKTALG